MKAANIRLKPTQAEKLTLAVLVTRFKQGTQRPVDQLHIPICLSRPETAVRGRRQLVHLRWRYVRKNKGLPPFSQELDKLIIQPAQENASMRALGFVSDYCRGSDQIPIRVT
jgi:hypothetical protein